MKMSSAIAPVTRSKDEARANYDRRSRRYAWSEGLFERASREAGVRAVAAKAGESVLEVGFGPGLSIIEFARAVGPSGRVTGLDVSPRMQEEAARRVARAGLADRVDLGVGDGNELPYPDSSFDVVFMSFTLELFDTPELATVLGECRRVLRADGRLGVVALALTEPPGVATRIYLWFHQRLPRFVDCRPIPTVDLMGATGFSVLEHTRRRLWGLPVDVLVARPVAKDPHAEGPPEGGSS